MGRKSEQYTVGDFWLDKRRDGASPDIWQIARYAAATRSVIYRSTKCRNIDDAKAAIHAHVQRELAKGRQPAEAARVVPQLMLYWSEHGKHTLRPKVIEGNLRNFIGFLMQDEVGPNVTFADLNHQVFERFRKWRMAPHSYDLTWREKTFEMRSEGVNGESVQRDLNTIGAALSHAVKAGRVPYAPRVASVPFALRSPPRDVQLSIAQMGAALAYSRAIKDKGLTRWLQLMIATCARPEAALAFDPAKQDRGDLVDLHPPAQPRTKKHNPVVPCIAPFRVVLDGWRADEAAADAVRSRKSAWHTMRRTLGWSADIIPKTIRHSVATELRRRCVPFEDQIRPLLGHGAATGITAVYAKYDPAYLGAAKDALTSIFNEVEAAAEKWSADHLLSKEGNTARKVIDVNTKKAQHS